jgi:hypothetical protein
MKNKDKILIIIAFCIIIFICYGLYTKYETFASKIGTGSVKMFAGSEIYYCNFSGRQWHSQNRNNSLKFNVYDDGTLTPIPDNSPTSCYQKDIINNYKYSMPSSDSFSYGSYGKGGAALILDPLQSNTSATTTTSVPTTTRASSITAAPIITAAPTTTRASSITAAPIITAAPTTTRSSSITAAPTTTPSITAAPTTPYNTQYLTNIKNQIGSGYSMMNNNRFIIMDNQSRLDNLNSRVNKLLNNINTLNNVSNNQNTQQQNNLNWY